MQDTSNTSRPSRPWLKITLFVSLALNLLIVGLVAGLAFSKSPRDRSPLLRDLGYGPFMQALPRSDKRQIIETLRSREGSFRENRAEFRREFDAFLTVLRSDPLDDAELRRVVDNQRNRISERLALGQNLLVEQIRQMSPEARARYADDLGDLFRRRPKGPPKRDGQ